MSKSKVKEKTNLEGEIFKMIETGKIKMKPRWYFVAGSVLTTLSLIGSFITATFLTNFALFLIRKQGPGIGKIQTAISIFPWWLPILAILGIIMGILLLRKYDFSYKKNFALVIVIFIISIILSAWLMEKTGINEVWSRRGPMRRFYQQYIIEKENNQFYPRRFQHLRR